MRYDLTTPCSSCPFRTDRPFHLRPERGESIAKSILGNTPFACHKTIDYDNDGGHTASDREQHCAGALIILERQLSSPTLLLHLARRAGIYDPDKLDSNAPVYSSLEVWLAALGEMEENVA
jgi:hypothetical protein